MAGDGPGAGPDNRPAARSDAAAPPLRVVGQSIPRVDGADKVTGRAVYASDVSLPGMLHARIWRSPVPHARLVRVDASRAAELPGVVAVLTRDDLTDIQPYFGVTVKDRPVLAIDRVRCVGDPVAAVAAIDPLVAEAALELIDVEFAELPALTDLDTALAPDAPAIHPQKYAAVGVYHDAEVDRTSHPNVCHSFHLSQGDVAAGLAAADVVFTETFTFPGTYQYAMEPHTAVAHWTDREITVWASAQHTYMVRKDLSDMFGVPLERVRLIVPFVGGGFGSKSFTKVEPVAVALSRKAGRPVRLALAVEEAFQTSRRHGARLEITSGVLRDGTLTARRCRIWLDGGAYSDTGPIVAEKVAMRSLGPYRIPNWQLESHLVYTNTPPAGSYRAIGGAQGYWAGESHADSLADRLGLDPVAFRLRNLAGSGDQFRTAFKAMDADLPGDLRRLRDAVARDWPDADPARIGYACGAMDPGARPVSVAIARLHANGNVTVAAGSTEIGQGVRTVLTQIVAEELALPVERVQVLGADTFFTPFDASTGASRSTVCMGLAVQAAAREIRSDLLKIAAAVLGLPEAELTVAGGAVQGGGRHLPFADLVRQRFGMPGGELIGRGHIGQPELPDSPMYYEIGMAAAEIDLDAETGVVRVPRYYTLADVGQVINPLMMAGQETGAALQGLGHTLFEELVVSGGQLVNNNLIDYRIPTMTDAPRFFSLVVENHDGPGPYGSKGGGEGAIVPVAPAIAGAVWRATGVRIRDLPLTPERVWRALQACDQRRDERVGIRLP